MKTAAALALIDKKKAAQAAAYKDAQAGLAAEKGLSDETRGYRAKDLEVKNTAEMAKLNADAVKVKLEGEKQVTDELKRQVDVRKEYQQKTEDLNIDTAQLLGAISSQEATLQKLVLDWQRAKAEAIKAGASPEYLQARQSNLQAKQADTQYGGYSSAITGFFSSLSDSMSKGMTDLKKTGNDLFKSLFTEALKPSLSQLQGLLTSAFKELFGSAGSSISSAVMGVVGLIGMLATTATKSDWSSSGAKSGVQTHEAVRGVISGDSSIEVEQLSNYFQAALDVEVVPILSQIEVNTRGSGGGGTGGTGPGASGSSSIIQVTGITYDILVQWLNQYFQQYLMKGAPA